MKTVLSHEASSVSVRCVVAVFSTFDNVLVLEDFGHEEVEEDHAEDALPGGLRDLVPHLSVQSVDFLNVAQTVPGGWGVGEHPNALVVHVSHLAPRVLKRRLAVDVEVLVLIDCRTLVGRLLQTLHEVLSSRSHV